MSREKQKNTQINSSVPFEYVNKHDLIQKIEPIIDNTLMRFGLIPVEIELVKESHRWFLRVYIFSKEREVNLEDCEKVSRSLSDFLEELIPFKYNLEVSSPGLERKIKSEKEFIIFNGKDINIKLKELVDGCDEEQFVGKIVDYDDNEGLTLYCYKTKDNIIIKKENILLAKLYSSEI